MLMIGEIKMATVAYAHIELTDEGVPVIAGTQTKMEQVVLDHLAHDWDAGEIHRQHPHLSLAQIHSALAYYYDHQAEMDRQIEEGLRQVAEIREGLGESLPSPTLAARGSQDGRAPILLVEAFDRNDRSFTTWQDDGVSIADSEETGPSRRLFADRTNRRDYVIQHGMAITRPFGSATRNMLFSAQTSEVSVGDSTTPSVIGASRPDTRSLTEKPRRSSALVHLHDYAIVDWMSGEESSPEEATPVGASTIALSQVEQALLTGYVKRGGSLFISGAEIGLDLVQRGKGPAFYEDVLKAYYQGSNTFKRNWRPYPNKVMPSSGGLFDGLDIFRFDDGTHGTYDADRVDYFLPLPEDRRAKSALLYQAGIGHAGLTWDSGGCARLVYFAFPFETIYPAGVRQAVMTRAMDYLDACGPPPRHVTYLPLVSQGE